MKGNFQEALSRAPEHKELPFPEEEFAARLQRLRTAMAEAELDLVFLSSPESIYYLTGFQGHWYQAQSGRNFPPSSGIAVHADHPDLIHFETPSEAVLTAIGAVSRDVRIFPLEARRDGLPFILAELRSTGWLRGTVGMELSSCRQNPVVSARYQDGFAAEGMQIADATELTRDLRRRKSPLEMDALNEAARIADIGMTAAAEHIAPGRTELEVFGEIIAAMTKAGGEFSGIIPPVMSGFRSNCLHPLSSRKVIGANERVNVDLCGVFKRYHCNLARSFWTGTPPDPVARLHEASIGAYAVLEDMLGPGAPVRPILEALQAYYEDAGIWDDCYWSGGYEFGIAFPPDWVGAFIYDLSMTGPDDFFTPMNALNYECNFFGPDSSGISATIDTFFVLEDKAIFPCSTPRELRIIKGT
ncbi:MAG: Xaa-Pro peptidase family protein [Pseudomonadota bacterium]